MLSSVDPVTDPSILRADNGVIATLSGRISQSGGSQPLIIDGPGTVVLSNQGNFWSRITTVNAGATLQGSNASISGSIIVNNGRLSWMKRQTSVLRAWGGPRRPGDAR